MQKIIILSPHPDDECLNGLFAIRAISESGAKVHNLAMSLGSDVARQAARKAELELACQKLNFENHICDFTDATIKLINEIQPDFIICPHAFDRHPTHIKVNKFLLDNIHQLSDCMILFNEYWFPMERPNLLVEAGSTHIKQIIEGLLCHAGEIARNPYHETFASWTVDNCRRGFEYLQGFGENVDYFKCGILYQINFLRNSKIITPKENLIISTKQNLLTTLGKIKN